MLASGVLTSESALPEMQLDRGPMRAAPPSHLPDGGPLARRPRGLVLASLGALALALFAGAAPAAADEVTTQEARYPQPVLLLGDCDATLSVIDLVPGRSYDITVTDSAGADVYTAAAYVATSDVLESFVTVPAGTHQLLIVDTVAPEFSAAREVAVAPCAEPTSELPVTDEPVADEPVADEPVAHESAVSAGPAVTAASAPDLTLEPFECDLLGATDVRVTASSLGSGTYLAGVTSGGSPVPAVADHTLTAGSSSVVFADLPNGGTYGVWLKDPSGRTVATASVTLEICDLPTLDEPALGTGLESGSDGARELAETGAPIALVIVSGLGALQGGALLAGLGMLRRRTL
jgi:hypothetical protein